MTREDAIEILSDEEISCLIGKFHGAKEALDLALAALRPVSREQVEKVWFREPYTRLETRSTPEGNRQYIAENICMACGSKTPIGHFCHNCGVALDDWAVDMMLERWREAIENERDNG